MTEERQVLVVGGGIAGLTAGLALASAGRSVAVLEQDRQAGGYATSFRRKGFTFDSVVDGLCGLAPGGPLRRILEAGGIDCSDLVLELPVARTALFGAERLDFPAEGSACRRFLRDRFPKEAEAVDKVFDSLVGCFEATERRPVEALWPAEGPPPFPPEHPFSRYRDRPYAAVLDEARVRDPLLRLAFCERLMFLGGGPERVSAASVANLLASTWRFGCQRVRGGLYRLVNRIVAAIRAKGGLVKTGCSVESLAPSGGGFEGETSALGTIRADRVVVACEPLGFLERAWRGPPLAAGPIERARAFPRSPSFFLLYLGVRAEWPEAPLSCGIFTEPENPRFEDSELEGPSPTFGVSVASEVDPSLAPAGGSTVVLHAFLPADRTLDADERDRMKERALLHLERLLPNVRERVVVCEVATPATLERYTRNPGGAAYGFAQTPERFEIVRDLAAALPPGLLAAGHWTDYGGGVLAAALSGHGAARRLLLGEG